MKQDFCSAEKDRNFITSLNRGLNLLRAFTQDRASLSFTEIVKESELSQTTVFRIIHTLEKLGYLKFDLKNRKYYVGPKVLELGYASFMNMRIKDIARPYMEELFKVIGENINLGILDGHEIVYIDQIRADKILNINLHIGSRIPIYNTAIGKAIMMYMPESKLNGIIEKLKEDPQARTFLKLNGGKLFKELEKGRERGFTTNIEEYISGAMAIAVPILNHERSIEGGINVSVPSARISMNELESKYAPLLVKKGREISSTLGFPIK